MAILGYDESTFGIIGDKIGKIIQRTRLTLICDECNEVQWTTSWDRYTHKKGKRDLCGKCLVKLGITGFGGKKHSDETLAKFIEIAKSRPHNPRGKRFSKWKVPIDDSHKQRRGLAREKNMSAEERRSILLEHKSQIMKDLWKNEEFKDSVLTNVITGHSGLHDDVKESIQNLGFENFLSEQRVGYYIADEVDFENKAIIEINGSYYHWDPRCPPKQHDTNRKSKEKKLSEDDRRYKYFLTHGYTVFVLWEIDWIENSRTVISQLQDWYLDLLNENLSPFIRSTLLDDSTLPSDWLRPRVG